MNDINKIKEILINNIEPNRQISTVLTENLKKILDYVEQLEKEKIISNTLILEQDKLVEISKLSIRDVINDLLLIKQKRQIIIDKLKIIANDKDFDTDVLIQQGKLKDFAQELFELFEKR